MRKRIRVGLLAAVAVLYVLSVPWYRETGGEITLVLGLPDWVATALGCYVLVAILNAAAWLVTDMTPEEDAPGMRPAPADGEAEAGREDSSA